MAEQNAARALQPESRVPAAPLAAAMPAMTAEQWRAVEEQGIPLSQSFMVAHPREKVWSFFSDPEALARCMPGARLTGETGDGLLQGEVTVKLGPIVAAFAGTAEIERDDAAQSGLIRGQGLDRKSASRARGIVRYRLVERGPEATRVDVTIQFLLAGRLAQFSRAGIVNDIANQITIAFARNLEARLSGTGDGDSPAPALDAGNLVFKALWTKIRATVVGLIRR
jgi:carbon-monoxide dehydrogenase small subunit